MSNALLTYDFILKKKNIQFKVCDQFFEGVYLPEKDQIILCSNALYRKEDFQNAMNRQMIMMYDMKRSKTYDLQNCKHIACSEVRAANFHSKC